MAVLWNGGIPAPAWSRVSGLLTSCIVAAGAAYSGGMAVLWNGGMAVLWNGGIPASAWSRGSGLLRA